MDSQRTNSQIQLTSLDKQKKVYGSFQVKLFEACEEADDCMDFLQWIRRAVRSSDMFTAILVVLLLLPVSMIFVGSSFREECPKEPRIVIYLLVTGSTGVLKVLLSLWRQVSFRRCQRYEGYYDHEDDDDETLVVTRMLKFTNDFLSVFLLIWFILGNVWVFSIWWPNPEASLHQPIDWCNNSLYIYCIAHIMACHVLAAITIVSVAILSVCFMCQQVD